VILREVIPILVACSCLSTCLAQEVFPSQSPVLPPSTSAHEEDFSETVVPITALKIGLRDIQSRFGSRPHLSSLSNIDVEARFGTGFCLDPECRFIATNYHVALIARPSKIKGEKVIQQYLATGPDDEGATMNDGPFISSVKYTLSRDLAIFELQRSLPHHHGVAFSVDDLQAGQEVDMYAYPKEAGTINPFRTLQQFHGTFKGETTTGLLAFDYSSSDKVIRPGASGGIVVDRKSQKIVAILNAIAKNDEATALAVPVQSLVEFVSKVQPYLAHSIFPSIKTISPVSADLYPKFVPPPAAMQHRPEEPYEVWVLRRNAQALVDSMRNFIAVQTFAWGSGDRSPSVQAAYEVRIYDGHERFRKYPDGKQEFEEVLPSLSIYIPAAEWSELPRMVGTELWLDIHQAADVVVNEQRMKVFQYRASIEDDVCAWKSYLGFGLFAHSKRSVAACYGEVWTDQDLNILRISEHFEEVTGSWRNYQAVVTYGWLKRADEPPRLIPLTISTQAVHNKKVYWCRGQVTNYQVFGSRVKITAVN
jgi:hypothetical protein